MKKYAMVAINKKEQDDGIHVRRVLISYLFKTKRKISGQEVTYYHGTKLIATDPYFTKKTATHKYILKNSYYKLVDVDSDMAITYAFKSDIYKKRKYHSIPDFEKEFKAKSKQIAVHKFKVRKELR